VKTLPTKKRGDPSDNLSSRRQDKVQGLKKGGVSHFRPGRAPMEAGKSGKIWSSQGGWGEKRKQSDCKTGGKAYFILSNQLSLHLNIGKSK